MIDLDAIEAAARKATQGRWALECFMTQTPMPAAIVIYPDGPRHEWKIVLTGSRNSSELDNWRYVALLGPDIVLALISELRGFRAKATEGR